MGCGTPSSPTAQSTVKTVNPRPSVPQRVHRLLEPLPGGLAFARLMGETVIVAWRYRAPGLAAEAAYFGLLSLPPLLLALVAGAGFASDFLGQETLGTLQSGLETWALRFLAPQTVEEVIMPTFYATVTAARGDVLSISFLITLWSGSRSLHVYLNAISIMYGQRAERGPVRARVLSLTTYLVALVVLALTLPLLLIGPSYLSSWLPGELEWLVRLYWPVVGLLGIASLTGLYHVATPVRSPYVRDLPGALFAVVMWVVGSLVIRTWAEQAVGGPSVFGPLAAPIVLLVYLYFLSLSVLLGASLNAAIRRLWPPPDYRGPRARINGWLEGRRGSDEGRGEPEEVDAKADEEAADRISGPR